MIESNEKPPQNRNFNDSFGILMITILVVSFIVVFAGEGYLMFQRLAAERERKKFMTGTYQVTCNGKTWKNVQNLRHDPETKTVRFLHQGKEYTITAPVVAIEFVADYPKQYQKLTKQ